MYVITGATGNTGRRVATGLLAEGKKVRVIGRSSERLRPLVDLGAEEFVGDIKDAATMKKAFGQAEAVYLLIPPDFNVPDFTGYQNEVAKAYAAGLEASSVKYVVTLSSVGAHLAAQNGPIKGLHYMEETINAIADIHVLHLRPAYFMENLYFAVEPLKNMGVLGASLRGDLELPMIATQDIAAFALQRLLKLDFAGKTTQELLGPRHITHNEIAKVIGKKVGKELPYTQFAYDDVKKAILGMGASENTAGVMVELYKGLNEKIITQQETRSAKNTTPTTIEEFADTFVQALN